MGAGDALDELKLLSEQLGVSDIVEFSGWAGDDLIQRCLSTADVCLSPDPLTPFNDASTMNKVVEYMAMGRPIVSFDLVESRFSAGDAAIYVRHNDELRVRAGDRCAASGSASDAGGWASWAAGRVEAGILVGDLAQGACSVL